MPNETVTSEKHMVKFSIYLYRKCARAKQEGVIYMTNPKNDNEEFHFNYLDSIPQLSRRHSEEMNWAYDVDDDSDEAVIAPKARKRRVIRKIRRGE
jgi:hypothetical protein